jgi:hypothetical protein
LMARATDAAYISPEASPTEKKTLTIHITDTKLCHLRETDGCEGMQQN